MTLLAIWLIADGAVALGVTFPSAGMVLGALAIAAGILLLAGR